MKKFLSKNMRIILLISIFSIVLIPNNLYANDDLEVDGFNIMPELDDNELWKINDQIKTIWSEAWHVMDHYNEEASNMKTSEQLASWVMNRDTIMNYLIFFVQFLSQIWLVVWTVFIMYAGYKYMLSAFGKGGVSSKIIVNAIIWVLIIIFSYAIMRILTSFIWLT
jgi:hypothetical protein